MSEATINDAEVQPEPKESATTPRFTEPAPAKDDDIAFDGDFDADRAKGLITRLRDENLKLKQDKRPQDEKDAGTIAALRREIDTMRPLAQKARELEESKKSDLQRITDRAEKAEKERDNHASTSTRLQVAMDKAPDGTPLSAIRAAAKRISGGTHAELEADAEEFFALIAPNGKPPAKDVIPGKPEDDQKPGGSDAVDPKKVAREALGRGRF